jgi:magnesium-protoporphyrin O-methyltransferase
MTCPHCRGVEKVFGDRVARRELRRYRRRGPSKSTRLLVDALRDEGVRDATILDVGGGVGVIYHELLAAGARSATHVDAAASYLAVARDEAERRAEADRVRFVHGDFVELAPEIAPADVVTLDRVICCYPDMRRLVGLSAVRARRLYGAVFPRDTWWVRLLQPIGNLLFRMQRSAFRLYLHPPSDIDEALRDAGLSRSYVARTPLWEVAVYARPR